MAAPEAPGCSPYSLRAYSLRCTDGHVLVGMDSHTTLSGKIVVGSHGLGVPDADLVQRRAWEVAQIQAHESPTSADWAEARRELHGRSISSEFASELGETLLPFSTRGLNAVISRDEATLGEELVREGMEEAEHERMLVARREALKE